MRRILDGLAAALLLLVLILTLPITVPYAVLRGITTRGGGLDRWLARALTRDGEQEYR